MNYWHEELKKIYKKSELNNLFFIKERLWNAQLSGGTGWEIFLLITNELKEIRKYYPEKYKLIEEESNNILRYGLKNGLITEG